MATSTAVRLGRHSRWHVRAGGWLATGAVDPAPVAYWACCCRAFHPEGPATSFWRPHLGL